jgi:hypothetical protein
VLVNSNPTTIMTDPDLAHRTYIGPMTPPLVEGIITSERPDALLPTMGGQTALNLAVSLADSGALDRLGVRLIGASLRPSAWTRTASSSSRPWTASGSRHRPQASGPPLRSASTSPRTSVSSLSSFHSEKERGSGQISGGR